MKHFGEIMFAKLHAWSPVVVGMFTLFLDNLTEINIMVQIAVGLASAFYIVTRAYYLIKNKGKERK